ncbi:DUF2470 domain-containing protein [Haloechinothrix salitolerans]|uniref:DUF2470 domain-containing protein n=1 Tax=Haloechinothrix salitolerans TaxID=926830 RepID=A0ABW2C6A3_9PSEU
MNATPVTALAPAPAERARTILAATASVMVRTTGYHAAIFTRPVVDNVGDMVLTMPYDAQLALAVRVAGTSSGAHATLQCADVAPVTMRDRVRATVTVTGRFTQPHRVHTDGADRTLVRFTPERATLDEDGATYPIPIDDLADAAPDPIAALEADFLTHLVDAHPDMVDVLANQVNPTLLLGARRVAPLRADRHGVVLRVERARDHVDVRLGFSAPVTSAVEFANAFGKLLHQPRRCRRQR